MASLRPPLSSTRTGRNWVAQFKPGDQGAAAALLDAMLLLNEEEVAVAIRRRLDALAPTRRGKRRHVALYAEREFDAGRIYEVVDYPV